MRSRPPALLFFSIVTLAALPATPAQPRNQNYVYRMFGGSADDVAKAQLTDAQGNTYVAGDFRTPRLGFGGVQFTNAGGSTKTSDIIVAKIDPNGQISWVVGWGGTAEDSVGALALNPTGTTLFVGGSFRSNILKFNDDAKGTTIEREDLWENSPPGANAFVVAVDARTGQPLKTIQIGDGDNDVQITAMAVDAPRNRLLVAGQFNGMALWPPGGSTYFINAPSEGPTFDAFVLAYDLTTYKVLGGGQLSGMGNDRINDLAVDPTTGAVYLAGDFASENFGLANGSPPRLATPAGTSSGFVVAMTVKLDAVIWARTTGPSSKATAMALDAASDALYLEGIFTSQTLLALAPVGTTTDITLAWLQASNGQPRWVAALPGPQDLVQEPSRNHLFVLGAFTGTVALGPTLSLKATMGRSDIYVVRVDATTGIPLGAQSYGKGSSIAARFVPACITLDTAINAVVMSGSYTDGNLTVSNVASMPAEPSSMQQMLDIFIARTPMPIQTVIIPAANATSATAATTPLALFGLRVAGGSGNVTVKGMAVDAQGSVYVVGDFASVSVTIGARKLANAGKSGRDIFVVKVAQSGQVEWAYSWGGTDDDTAASIVLAPNGTDFYVAGNFKSTALLLDDQTSITRKVDLGDDDDGGEFSWLDDDKGGLPGDDDDDDQSSSAQPTTSSSSLSPMPSPNSNAFVAKVNSRGEVLWTKAIGEEDGEDVAVALAATKDAVHVTGAFTSMRMPIGESLVVVNSGSEKNRTAGVFWAAFSTETGEALGVTSFGNAGQDAPTDMVVDANVDLQEQPALLISGSYAGGGLIVRGMNSSLNENQTLPAPEAGKGAAAFLIAIRGTRIAWAQGFGADSRIVRMAVDAPGRAVYAVGSFPSLAAGGGEVSALVKIHLGTGNVIWSRVLPNPANVATDKLGFVYVSGLFTGSLSVSPNASVSTKNSNGDLYIAKFDGRDGSGLQVTSHGGAGGIGRYSGQDLEVDTNGAVYLAGSYRGDSLSIGGAQTLPSAGSTYYDGFVGRVWLQPTYEGATRPPFEPMALEPGTARPTLSPGVDGNSTTQPTSSPSKPPTRAPTRVPSSRPSEATSTVILTNAPTAMTTVAPTVKAATPSPTRTQVVSEKAALTSQEFCATLPINVVDGTQTAPPSVTSSPTLGVQQQQQQQQAMASAPSANQANPAVQQPPSPSSVAQFPTGVVPSSTPKPQPFAESVVSAPTMINATRGSQVWDVIVTYAGDASRMAALQQAFYQLVKPYATSFKAGTAVPTPTPPRRQRRKRTLLSTTTPCSDPSVPKLDVPFRIATPDATAADAVLSAFQQATAGKVVILGAADSFDGSVLCRVAFAQATTPSSSTLLSPAMISSLDEIKPDMVPGPDVADSQSESDKTIDVGNAEKNMPQTTGNSSDGAKGSSSNLDRGGVIAGALVGTILLTCTVVGVFVQRRRIQKRERTVDMGGTPGE